MNLDALFARPIAHRGLHDRARGVIENSRAAAAKAIAAGYGIEVDVQISADGVAMVFHDAELDRLTKENGPVASRTAAELARIALKDSAARDTIWTLTDLLDLVAGRVPLVVEIKSHWDQDMRLADATAQALGRYSGTTGAKSFDPRVVARLGRSMPGLARGLIGYAYHDREAEHLSLRRRIALRNLAYLPFSRPHFLSWDVRNLSNPALRFARERLHLPVMTWTVRTPADQARAALGADQMVFEGFRP